MWWYLLFIMMEISTASSKYEFCRNEASSAVIDGAEGMLPSSFQKSNLTPTQVTRVFVLENGIRRRIHSSVDMAYTQYANQLVHLMSSVDETLRAMDFVDAASPLLRSIHRAYKDQAKLLPQLWEENESVLKALSNPFGIEYIQTIVSSAQYEWQEESFMSTFAGGSTNTSGGVSYDSMDQLLAHLSRDWSERGLETRKWLYDEGILPALQSAVPLDRNSQGLTVVNSKRILVPGAAMGRLAVELAALGYRVEASECSGAMVNAFTRIIDHILPSDSTVTIFPHLNSPFIDDWDFNLRLSPVVIPSLDSGNITRWAKLRRSLPSFSSSSSSSSSTTTTTTTTTTTPLQPDFGHLDISLGDFVTWYKQPMHENTFDAVVTNFFIDTASNVLEYLAVIRHVLRVGGVWINCGPLHYHQNQHQQQQRQSTAAKKTAPSPPPPPLSSSSSSSSSSSPSSTTTTTTTTAAAAAAATSSSFASLPLRYSHQQVKEIASAFGFQVISDRVLQGSYSGEQFVNMKPDFYRFPLTVYGLESGGNSQQTETVDMSVDDWVRPNFIML